MSGMGSLAAPPTISYRVQRYNIALISTANDNPSTSLAIIIAIEIDIILINMHLLCVCTYASLRCIGENMY